MAAMRLHHMPRSLLQLVTSILLLPQTIHANPHPEPAALAGFSYDQLFARWACNGQYCGVSSQVCCTGGSTCYTNALDQAACGAGTYYAATTTVQAAAGGYWQYYTTIYDVTITSVVSTYIAAGATVVPAVATTTVGNCEWNACGNKCCGNNEYCYAANTCSPAAYASSPIATATTTVVGATAGAPVRGTSSSVVVITQTTSPTTTVPFQSPVATGANVTLIAQQANNGSGGLSGGAIAGIVIGVLAGLAILALILFCCCAKGIIDGFLALFGMGGRRGGNRRTEVEEYERRSHRTSGGGGGGSRVRRTWYGAARPARSRREEREEREEKRDRRGGELLGIGAGLAALWAILGLKRSRRRQNEEKYSENSYESEYLGTSESSESSPPRTHGGRSYGGRPVR